MADRPAGPPKVRMRTKPLLATPAEVKEYEQTRVVAATDVAATVQEESAVADAADLYPGNPKVVSTRVGSIFSKKPAAVAASVAAAEVKAASTAVRPPPEPTGVRAPPKPTAQKPKEEEKPKVVLDYESLPDISEFGKKLRPLAEGMLEETYDDPYYLKADVPSSDPRHLSSSFVPTTRRGFADFIQTQFKHFELPKLKAPDPEACAKQGAKGADQLQIYLYQQFIREYMRSESPYRGILVYHGLGSGKTCSAIAASEALFAKARKKIIIMTPKSLRRNFTKELMTCGFQHYRLQNHWVEMGNGDTQQLFASTILNLPDSYIKKAPSFFVPDFDKKNEPNYNTLEPVKQKQVYSQIQAMIDNQFKFIHYNGVTASRLKEWACAEPANRLFDNAVIVIDEVHNLIRLMQETIEPYLQSVANLRRKIRPEPVTVGRWNPGLCGQSQNYKRGFLFYRLLLDAQNSKIIGLSGTPLINYPEEVAILMNILHGYIQVANFSVKRANDKQIEEIITAANRNPYIDFVEVKKAGEGATILLTPLPQRTIKKFSGTEMKGVARVKDSEEYPDFTKVIADFKGSFTGKLSFTDTIFKAEPLLPPFSKEFNEKFVNTIRGTIQEDRELVLAKRMTGLISYYKGSKEELMPKVLCDEVVKCPMSQYQQAEYMKVRVEEIKNEEKEKKTRKTQGMGAKQAAIWNDIYDIKLKKQQSSYRMASRQCCNFVFPKEVKRPRTTDIDEEILEVGEEPEDIIDGELEAGGKSKEDKEAEAAAKKEDEEIDEKERAGVAATAAVDDEEEEAKKEPSKKSAAKGKKRRDSIYDAFAVGGGSDDEESESSETKTLRKQCLEGRQPGEKYQTAITRAKECLQKLYLDKLEIATDEGQSKLNMYSPKYQAMLERIMSSPGSNLVYSQFLQMEGIGIFAIAMIANGFKPIHIKQEGGTYRFSKATLKSLREKKDQPRFLMFTGEEEEDVRKLALDVFNVKLTELPETLRKPLQDNGYTDNKLGQLCRVFCITSAGAEGLSLKNVRRVHIMETYWNDVRLTQVKGRAIRICSHVDFERVEDRSVEIFTYVSTFDARALKGQQGWAIDNDVVQADVIELPDEDLISLGIDKPAGVASYILTSDERLKLTSERKRNITRNLENIMKSVAVDCRLNAAENGGQADPPKICGVPEAGKVAPPIECLYLEGKVGDFLYHPILENDIVASKEFKRAKPDVIKASRYRKGGVDYIVVSKTDAVTGLTTSYDVYAADDTTMKTKIGFFRALADGKPDIASFHLYTKDELDALAGPKKAEPESESESEEDLPSTIEEIDAMIVDAYPGVGGRTKDEIELDKYPTGPLIKDEYQSVNTSSHDNDCLIHSFLIDVSPSFRKLTLKEKNSFANTFRRSLLPKLYKLKNDSLPEKLYSKALVKQLNTTNFLTDEHEQALGYFFNVNIINFLIQRQKVEGKRKQFIFTAASGPFEKDRPTVLIFNPDNEHFRAIRKLTGTDSTYEFTSEEGEEILQLYSGYSTVERDCDFVVDEEVIHNGVRKKIVEVLYGDEDPVTKRLKCEYVRFVLQGESIPIEAIEKIGAKKPAVVEAPPAPSSSSTSEEEESEEEESEVESEAESEEEEEEEEEESEVESEAGSNAELNVKLSNNSEEEEEELEFLEYKPTINGKKQQYNILAIKDPKTKKIVKYDAYNPGKHTKKIGTFGVKLSSDGEIIPDKTTFKSV